MGKVRSPRVLAFVHEYVWGEHAGNGAKCVLAAKLSLKEPENARKYAHQLLRQKNVRELIDAESAEKETLLKQKAVRVADEVYAQSVARLSDAYDESGNVRPMKDWPEELKRALAACEVEITPSSSGTADDGPYERSSAAAILKLKLVDKKASQELFLRYAGKLNGKLEIDGNGEPITVTFNLSAAPK